jgi:hypothetical protein
LCLARKQGARVFFHFIVRMLPTGHGAARDIYFWEDFFRAAIASQNLPTSCRLRLGYHPTLLLLIFVGNECCSGCFVQGHGPEG